MEIQNLIIFTFRFENRVSKYSKEISFTNDPYMKNLVLAEFFLDQQDVKNLYYLNESNRRNNIFIHIN